MKLLNLLREKIIFFFLPAFYLPMFDDLHSIVHMGMNCGLKTK